MDWSSILVNSTAIRGRCKPASKRRPKCLDGLCSSLPEFHPRAPRPTRPDSSAASRGCQRPGSSLAKRLPTRGLATGLTFMPISQQISNGNTAQSALLLEHLSAARSTVGASRARARAQLSPLPCRQHHTDATSRRATSSDYDLDLRPSHLGLGERQPKPLVRRLS